MIRKVKQEDCKAIAAIYNVYIANSTITFETEPVSEEEMERRIFTIASQYPYLVCEIDNAVVGYCYAHAWKERAAYSKTFETSGYLFLKLGFKQVSLFKEVGIKFGRRLDVSDYELLLD